MQFLSRNTFDEMSKVNDINRKKTTLKLITFILDNSIEEWSVCYNQPLPRNFFDGKDCAPDIIIFDESDKPNVIIDLCHDYEFKQTIELANKYYKEIPSVQEIFIYNYEKELWHCVTAPDNSYCELISEDLDDAFN